MTATTTTILVISMPSTLRVPDTIIAQARVTRSTRACTLATARMTTLFVVFLAATS